MDSRYEFNAPKFVDFTQMNDTYDSSDNWFDEKEGDVGGVSIDMEPYYQSGSGFANATAAISAAIQPNNPAKESNCGDMPPPDIIPPGCKPQNTSSPVVDNKTDKKVYNLVKNEQSDSLDTDTRSSKDKDIKKTIDRGILNLTPVVNEEIQPVRPVSQLSLKPSLQPVRTSTEESIEDDDDEEPLHSQVSQLSPKSRLQPIRTSTEENIENDDDVDDKEEESKSPDTLNRSYTIERDTEHHQTRTPVINRSQPIRTKVSKLTPKTRFQPIRNSKPIDYSDSKQPKRKSVMPANEAEPVKKKRMTPQRGAAKMALVKPPQRGTAKLAVDKMRQLQQQTRDRRRVNEKNMKRALEGQKVAPNFKNKPTKPVPFNFVLPDKMKVPPQPPKKWESMGEATTKFFQKTPARFRQDMPEKSKPLQITKPVTPQLMTRGRSRISHVEGAKEIEEKIVEQMKSYQFKATKLNPKIIDMKGMYGVKPIPQPTSTELKPFNFKIEQRIHQRSGETNECEEIDKSKRVDKTLKPTIPKPFSFEGRDKDRYSKKEEKIKNFLEEEKKAHEFHATMLPSFSPEVLPEVLTKGPTKPIPFNISEGSQPYQDKLEEKLRREAEEEKARRNFKAQDCTVTATQPFQAVKGLIPPTAVDNFILHSELRASERSKYDKWLQEKEKLEEEEKTRLQQERLLEEEEEVKKLRKDIVHKANPIRSYKPVEVQKSDIPLTEAQTPNLEIKKRAAFRELQKANK